MFSRRITSIIVICAAIVVGATPALAGKGGNGGSGGSGGSTSSSSSISIASINGVSAASVQNPAPKLGDSVTFNTSVASLSGNEYPMVDLQCYQDVNGDGRVDTSLSGPDVVYTSLDTPSSTYVMGGAASIWTYRGGGSAVCLANLVAISWKGGVESARQLAALAPWVAAG